MILPTDMSPIYKKDDLLFFKGNRNDESDDRLIIDASKIDFISNYMQKNSLKSIMINSAYFPINNLAFLKSFTFVERIFIVDNNLDITPLNNLKQLLVIRMGAFTGVIDFDNFPSLQVLGINWTNKLKNLENSKNLTGLWLDNYKMNDLERLGNFDKLSYLYLYKPSITSLKGIEDMYSLRELNIDTASKLESLDGLHDANKNLINLDVYNASKLTGYSALAYLVNLEKLRFTKTGDMNDIHIFKLLPNLKRVVLGTKVLDGNMSYLKDIKEYKFKNFPHYNLKS